MMNKREKITRKNDEKEWKKQWNMMKKREENTNKWWQREKKTMKHDEKERKKQGNMMKNRETTMKNDEKDRKTMKHYEK